MVGNVLLAVDDVLSFVEGGVVLVITVELVGKISYDRLAAGCV
ncbi:MAG: hypothetical protein QOK48_808 [Blastocatellia bacterium]|jgi:hypothetical protein|nr:hypothetical protein [Blastocatellia bacterium]